MADFVLQAKFRSALGKSASRRLRRDNKVPAVVYGRGKEGVTITVEVPELAKALKSHSSLLDLTVDGQARKVIVKELNTHPVRGDFQHVDFYEVAMDRAVETTTTIYILGEEEREQDGGIMNLVNRELDISCLPGSIPEYIELDVSGLVINDTIHVSDLILPEGVEVLTDAAEVVLTITDPATLEEPEEEDVDEMEEPEVIGENDDEEKEE